MVKPSFTTTDILHLRLYNQQISKTKFKKPAEIVEWLGAIQAQDYPGVKWSIALRLPHFSDEDIEKAVADKTIIRTWAVRGTLHFVAAQDIRWILSLVAPRIIASNALRYKQLKLNSKILERSKSILEKVLQGGKQLTREELTTAFLNAGIKADGVRLSHILQRSGLEQIICFGIRRGKQFTFTLLDEWMPKSKTIDYEKALAEVARRYFISRGPATLQDFIWWSGLSAADARASLEMIRSKLIEKTLDNKMYWMSESIQTSKSSKAYLLPGFDEYLIGYKDRSAVIESEYIKRLNTGGGILSPTIIINGKVAGTWKREFKKDKVIIKSKLFNSITKVNKRKLFEAAERFGKFHNMSVELYPL